MDTTYVFISLLVVLPNHVKCDYLTITSALPRHQEIFIIERNKYLTNVMQEDIDSTMLSVKEQDCLLHCQQLEEKCAAINMEEVTFFNCVFINKQALNFIQESKDQKTVVAKGQNQRCSGNCRLGVCGRCKCLDVCNSKYPMVCHCIEVQDLNVESCEDAVKNIDISGIYQLSLPNGITTRVLCDIKQNSEVWTLLMHRWESDKFPIEETEYHNGFGDFAHYYWLGLRNLFAITAVNQVLLHVQYTTKDDVTRIYEYEGFVINDNQTYSMMYEQFVPKVEPDCPELQCPDSRKCISRDQLCNYQYSPDCENSEDEQYCGNSYGSYSNGFGNGGAYDYGNGHTEASCIDRCFETRRSTDSSVNGVTLSFSGNCRCNSNMNSITANTPYLACRIINGNCNFIPGVVTNSWTDHYYSVTSTWCAQTCVNNGRYGADFNTDNNQCWCYNQYVTISGYISGYISIHLVHVSATCTSGQLYCDGRCINSDQVCDNVFDCQDGLDETFCSKNLEDNFRNIAGEPFGACNSDFGVWWGAKCKYNGDLIVPTSKNSINWSHDRNVKFIKIKFRLKN